MDSSTPHDKVGFFAQLDSLAEVSEDEQEATKKYRIEEQRRARHLAFFNINAIVTAPAGHHRVRRTSSAPTPSAPVAANNLIVNTPVDIQKSPRNTVSIIIEDSDIDETPVAPASGSLIRSVLQRSMTNPLPLAAAARLVGSISNTSPSVNSRMGKRKRAQYSKLGPPKPQIFTGLRFHYIPDNKINPLRRRRIENAVGHGALWERNVLVATHVIVDEGLAWKDIEPRVASVMTRVQPPVLVNAIFPLECIEHHMLVNSSQQRYQIPGSPDSVPVPAGTLPPEEPASSIESLQIKAKPQSDPKKWDYIPPPATPEDDATQSPRENREAQFTPAVVPSATQSNHAASLAEAAAAPSIDGETRHGSASSLSSLNLEQTHSAVSHTEDELSSLIEQVKSGRDLSPDNDDNGNEVEIIGEGGIVDESDDDPIVKPSPKRQAAGSRGRKKDISWDDLFACNRGGTIDKSAWKSNPNASVIEILEKQLDSHTSFGERWQPAAYRKAINALKRQTERITSYEQAIRIPNIGDSIAKHIVEIVTTGRLKQLDEAENDEMRQVLTLFLGVYGVGQAQANKWYAQGHRTLDDLKLKATLSTNQRMGVEHYEDLNSRIPRREVEAIGRHVKDAAARIDHEVELLIGGSYRRGADTSGDVDFIVTKKGTTSAGDLVPFLEKLIAQLTASTFLVFTVAALHTRRSGKDGPGSKWHGCCVLPQGTDEAELNVIGQPKWRRIDFLLVPETEYGAALIYFTGNEVFNRSIRLLASKKCMRLNQRGLYKDVMRGAGRVKLTEGELVEGRDEKRIFEILGVRWREPWDRWA